MTSEPVLAPPSRIEPLKQPRTSVCLPALGCTGTHGCTWRQVVEAKAPKKRAEVADFSALAEEGPRASKRAVGKKAEAPLKAEASLAKPQALLSTRPLAEQRRVLKLRFAQVRRETEGLLLELALCFVHIVSPCS